MKKAVVLFSTAVLLAAAAPAAAQEEAPEQPPRTWTTGWLGGYTNPGTVAHGDKQWSFASAFAGGLGVHRQLGRSLAVGLDASFSPAPYAVRSGPDNKKVEREGRSRLVTALATGRLRYGGGSSFFMYLTGGAGALVYGMPEMNRWDPDFALLFGTGLEYRPSVKHAVFVEWGRYWSYHQRNGIDQNMTEHGHLRAGVRLGW